MNAPRKSTGPDDISKYFHSDNDDDGAETESNGTQQENVLDDNVDYEKFVTFSAFKSKRPSLPTARSSDDNGNDTAEEEKLDRSTRRKSVSFKAPREGLRKCETLTFSCFQMKAHLALK